MVFDDLRKTVLSQRFDVTDHADEEAAADHLTLQEVTHSVGAGRIIEDYPEDRPYPSCLVFGQTEQGEPVHSVWGFDENLEWAYLVTVYRPDPQRWIDWTKRRTQS